MHFDSIEGLSDEEINELYGSVDQENMFIGSCACSSASGLVYFGSHLFYASTPYCTSSTRHCGYCELGLTTKDICSSWCYRHGFTISRFAVACFCSATSRRVNWPSCST